MIAHASARSAARAARAAPAARGLATASRSRFDLPPTENEPMLDYAPGSAERRDLEAALRRLRDAPPAQVPAVVGAREVMLDGPVLRHVMPSQHAHVLAEYRQTDEATTLEAIEAAGRAKAAWEMLPWEQRAAIFLRAADLVAGKYRAELCAAVMLGASKNAWQAEIDAAAELADFFRFGARYLHEIYGEQPRAHAPGTWNRLEYRPLEGFVLAITPFNFTAIGGNLPGAPAMCGNTTLWKPAGTTLLSNWVTLNILREAGLPDGVINFLPGHGEPVGRAALAHPDLAAVHFTGSTGVFRHLWSEVGANIGRYRTYPRLVGETGGKNFHFVHESADTANVINQTLRSAFEYQGQKCSACSRLYVPASMWPEVRDGLAERLARVKVGQPDDLENFMCAVIDEPAFDRLAGAIEGARADPACEIVAGGTYDKSEGFFVQPTVIRTTNPRSHTMENELFGPVLTVYVYENDKFDEALRLCDETSPYGLTGAIFGEDQQALEHMTDALRNAAGNFYVNDKSTGAVVGQQPFGGARASGTNDKAGAPINMHRWLSPRTIKTSLARQTSFEYPHMAPSK